MRLYKLIPGAIYFPRPSPAKYHRRFGLYFRIRDGNECFPKTIRTRKVVNLWDMYAVMIRLKIISA